MLVYVNQLEFTGSEALANVFNSISGWLKEQTRHHFTKEELVSGEEFFFDGKKVRTYKADSREPELYGILFSNPDRTVKGRQWITEIGVKVQGENVLFTLLLETSDISTRVTEIPVTTKPRLIEYVGRHECLAPDTVGISVRRLKSEEMNFRAFLLEIERVDREYPIVLVSHEFGGNCIINPNTLQRHLIGLAQVVVVSEDVDTWMMERELTRRYSAWGGAINVIYPSYGRDTCRNTLFVIDKLKSLLDQDVNINLDILSHITHFSNGRRKRKHFSPQDVRAKRLSDHRRYLKERYQEAKDDTEQQELLEEAFRQIEEHDQVLSELNEKFQDEIESERMQTLDALEQIEDREGEIWKLKGKLDSLQKSKGCADYLVPPEVFDTVSNPTPEKCLNLIEMTFSERAEILGSAWKSSKASVSFRYGAKLADLLSRLMTEYYESICNSPDSKARKVFTDSEYAATESEPVKSSKELREKRMFEYRGEPVPMYRHLKIGVADSVQETIRVHFYWDSQRKKIVIGYCGKHLPLP